MTFICIYHPSLWTFTCFGGAPCLIVYVPESHTLSNYRVRLVSGKKKIRFESDHILTELSGSLMPIIDGNDLILCLNQTKYRKS